MTRTPEHDIAISLGLARSTQVLQVRALYKARNKRPGVVDEGLNAACWAEVLGR